MEQVLMMTRELLHGEFNIELVMSINAQPELRDGIIQELIDLAWEADMYSDENNTKEDITHYQAKCDAIIEILGGRA